MIEIYVLLLDPIIVNSPILRLYPIEVVLPILCMGSLRSHPLLVFSVFSSVMVPTATHQS